MEAGRSGGPEVEAGRSGGPEVEAGRSGGLEVELDTRGIPMVPKDMQLRGGRREWYAPPVSWGAFGEHAN